MFSFFKKSKKIAFPIGTVIQQDMHSHILPGIDDGAPDVDTAVALIEGMVQCGVKKFMGTPHIMVELHKNNRDTITRAYEQLQQAVQERGMAIELSYAAEYMIDEGFLNIVEEGNLLTVTENRILVETPFYSEPFDIEDVLFHIESAGYKAILAHPERYHYVDSKLKVFEKYLDRDVALQLNVLSLSGYYGSKEKEVAEQLLQAGMYRYIGTDLHHERHMKRLAYMQLDEKIVKKLEQTDWQNKFI